MLFSLAAFSTLLASVSAHATFQELWVNGVDQGGYCVRLPLSNSPVTDVTSNDLTCNVTPTPALGKCAAMPGDSVAVEMHQQPGDRSCGTEAIGGAHYGPINIYMAKVSDSSTADGPSASWFKISEMGMPSSNPDYWGTEVLNDNCGHYTFTVPKDIAPGDYLIRAEVIALHVASTVGGAQFYMSCYQVTVGGSGTANPPTVKIPGAYSAQDPGILINIYTQLNSYTIPGPNPYNLPSPTVATTAWPTTATWNTAQQPSSDPTTPPPGAPTKTSGSGGSSSSSSSSGGGGSTHSTSSTSSAPAATQTKYGQCGGQGWTGPTVCAAGSTCQSSSPYYSQCL